MLLNNSDKGANNCQFFWPKYQRAFSENQPAYKTRSEDDKIDEPHVKEFEQWQQYLAIWRNELSERSKKGRQGVFLVLIEKPNKDQQIYYEVFNSVTLIKYRNGEDFMNKNNGETVSFKCRDTLVEKLTHRLMNYCFGSSLWLRGYESGHPSQHYRLWENNYKAFTRIDKNLASYRVNCVLDAFFALNAYLDIFYNYQD